MFLYLLTWCTLRLYLKQLLWKKTSGSWCAITWNSLTIVAGLIGTLAWMSETILGLIWSIRSWKYFWCYFYLSGWLSTGHNSQISYILLSCSKTIPFHLLNSFILIFSCSGWIASYISSLEGKNVSHLPRSQ